MHFIGYLLELTYSEDLSYKSCFALRSTCYEHAELKTCFFWFDLKLCLLTSLFSSAFFCSLLAIFDVNRWCSTWILCSCVLYKWIFSEHFRCSRVQAYNLVCYIDDLLLNYLLHCCMYSCTRCPKISDTPSFNQT